MMMAYNSEIGIERRSNNRNGDGETYCNEKYIFLVKILWVEMWYCLDI